MSLSLSEQEAAPLKKLIEQEKAKAMAMIPEGKKAKESDDPHFNETDDEVRKQDARSSVKMKAKVQNKYRRLSYSHACSMHKALSLHPTLCGVALNSCLDDLVPITLPLGAGVSCV